MKKIFGLFIVIACACPALALAAFNDVTLTTSAVISVGGYTLNVSGSSATVQSIVVHTNSFSVTLAGGSSLKVSSPTRNMLTSNVASDVTNTLCTNGESSLTLVYTGTTTITNVITPSSSVCSSGSGGGGGGGGGSSSAPASSGSLVMVSPQSTSTATSTVAATSTSARTPAVTGSTAIQGMTPVVNSFTFLKNLRYLMADPDVVQLQQYLNAHGFVVAKSGTGSPGHETTYFGKATRAALIKFQEAHAADILAPSGLTQGTGYFGPGTRAFVNKTQ